MAKDVTLLGASYEDVPAIELPQTGGGTARFIDPVGTETITENGTYDVTEVASAVIRIPIQHYYTGSSEPPASLGENGDIYLRTK